MKFSEWQGSHRKNIIIAAGANPAIPPIPGFDQIKVLHTNNIWELRQKPNRLIVMGGGPIGSELGQCFARLGVNVTQVEASSQLLTREDDEVVEIMQKRFKDDGVDLKLNTRAKEVVVRNGKKYLLAQQKSDIIEIEFDEIFVAVGRKPNVTGYGIEELGIKLTERKAIAVDEYSRTNIKNIFACGDVTSPYQFTHMAAHQAWYCAVNALFQPLKMFKMDMSIVPWCTLHGPRDRARGTQ